MGTGASRNKKKKTSPDLGKSGSQPNLNNPGNNQQDFFSPRDRSPQDIQYEDYNSPSQANPNPGLSRPGRQLNSNASAPVIPKSQTLNASKISQDQNVSTVNQAGKGKKAGTKNTIVPASLRAPCRVISDTWADRIYFDEKELKRLRKRFAMVDYDQRGEITVEQLGGIMELISNPFRERIMNLTEDKLNTERRNRLSFDEFARILSVFNHKCPIDIKMKYFFRMYDINGDGYVDDKDIATMLKFVFFVREMKEQDGDGVFETSLTNDEFVEKMSRDIIATYDINQDKTLDLNEFKNMFLDGDVETRMNITF